MENYNSDEIRYLEAKKRVKEIKGFYIHLLAYICVNLFIAFLNYRGLEPGESYFQWSNFLTLIFWGIGLAAHASGVFLPNYILGKEWEEKKIRELMEKYKQS